MMLASLAKFVMGAANPGTSPIWFGVTVSADRPKTPTHRTRNGNRNGRTVARFIAVASGVHAMKILYFCNLPRSDPPPVDKGHCSHESCLCLHRHPRSLHTHLHIRDPLVPASEAHAANRESEEALAGEGSLVPPWLYRMRAHAHSRAFRGVTKTQFPSVFFSRKFSRPARSWSSPT